LNVLPAIGVYAAIRREKGEPFSFPGGPSFVWEAADADLVADVMVWAAQSPQAANEAFNITNGDVFEWRNLWPALAETLGVETGPGMPMSVTAYLEKNADVWDQVVAKYDLRSQNLRELVGQGDQDADFAFAYGAPEGPRAFVSTIKLRQAGFTRTIDTQDSFRNALQSLIDHKWELETGLVFACVTIGAHVPDPDIDGHGVAARTWEFLRELDSGTERVHTAQADWGVANERALTPQT